MATRLQSIAIGFGSAKQPDITTVSPTFNRWRQLSGDPITLEYHTETDKDEIGKGNEFISEGGVFPTYLDINHPIRKYASAEFTAWAWGYAMGDVALASGLYTIHPIDPASTLELPYFSAVQQLAEGGGSSID